MADLMIPSSPSSQTATPTSTGTVDVTANAPSVTPPSPACEQLLLQSSGGTPSSPSANGTIKIPHPHKNLNNGQQMSCTGDDSVLDSNSSHKNNYSNMNLSKSTTTATSSPGVVLQHNRNHSHPLIFSTCANNNNNKNNNNVDSPSHSSVTPEMAMANNSMNNIIAATTAALPSSLNPSSSSPSSTAAAMSTVTMDVLNLDFVNGNSSYCHNNNNTSPLSCWPKKSPSQVEHQQTEDHSLHNLHNHSNHAVVSSSPGGDSISNNVPTKVPGEIPESVMKYLLTKTDSVDSTKSTHSSANSSSTGSPGGQVVSTNSSTEHYPHNNNNKRLQEFLVDLDALQSTTEIAKVLENFNAILERIEQEDDKEALEGLEALTTPLSPTVLQCPTATVSSTSRIKNSVETLAELLLSGCGDEEDEDLLIIIDENDSESLQAGAPCHINKSAEIGVLIETLENSNSEINLEEDDELDDVSSLVEIEGDLDQEEGYESDRPIVRASMRKLRPVKLLPMPSSSHFNNHHHHLNLSSNANLGNHHNHAFTTPPPTPVTPRANSPVDATTLLSSPIANKIIVTSLMNNLNSDSNNQRVSTSQSDHNHNHNVVAASCSTSASSVLVPTLEALHVASGSGQSRSHSRNQSNSSQIIQFHQNPAVTIATNPGFPEVSVSNNGNNGAAPTNNATTSSAGTSNGNGGQRPGNINNNTSSNNNAGTSSSSTSGTSNPGPSDCGVTNRGGQNCSGSPTATGGSGNAQGSSSSQTQNGVANDARRTTSTTTSPTNAASPSATGNATSGNNANGTRSTRPRAPQAPPQASQQQQRGAATGAASGTNGVHRMPAGRWPHRLSSVLAVVGCTLGLNNICRFSLLSVQYGANFILQFIFLSIVFGIPLLTFHMSIGQYLSSGIIDMWKISPIFQGIGVGLVISQAMIGIYTTVGVSWIFIYFRDSFITRQDQYRWGKCVREFGDCDQTNVGYNSTVHLYNETVPDYFNAVVLQRTSPGYPESAYVPSSLKFTVAFNLAVVWMLVFVSLSKGLKSYGKVVHGFVLAPVAALFVLAFKMVNLVQAGGSLFGQTQWSNFFFSSQTWVAAARETFFTWGLLGACVMQITAHNRHSHSLKSDSVIVIMVTLVVLMLSAFIGNACHSILTAPNAILPQEQFSYVSSSFESKSTYRFLRVENPDDPSDTDMYDHHQISFLMGVRVIKHEHGTDFHQRSGYQVLRLATELFPATMAVMSQAGMSSFWTVLFYFAFVLFGIAQQIAIWHCVIKGIIAVKGKVLRSWETTITFFVCGLGFVLGLPLCTETGIFIEYFMDYAIGSGWWIMVLYLLELIAVFIVRGAPYCGENIVTVLVTGRSRIAAVLAPLISFIWNVIMPVAILVLSIASFKNGNIRELYDWNPKHGYRFWPSWTREVGSLIQLVPILAVPFVAILQSCRYLSSGPPDLFDRMQQLYRPNSQGLFGNALSGSFNDNGDSSSGSSRNGNSSRGPEDPPPKYTPPPSYSTATGAKIAKFLRNSFRRSLRRLSSPGGPSTSSASPDNLPPPPNYASVILEINSQRGHQSSSCRTSTTGAGASGLLNPIMVPPPTYDESTMAGVAAGASNSNNSSSGGISKAMTMIKTVDSDGALGSKLYQIQLSQTLGRSLAEGSKERASLRRIASDITSRDIARMLRASLRRGSNRDSPEASTSAAAAANSGAPSRTSAYSATSSPGHGIIVTIPNTSGMAEGHGHGHNGNPCEYTFGPNSIEKVEYDLEMLNEFSRQPAPSTSGSAMANNNNANVNHSRQSSSSSNAPGAASSFGFNFGFNRARNRNSNDSQLALITSGVYEDLSVTSGGLMGALVDGEIEIDQFTQLNLPRRDSLSQLNVLDLEGQEGNVNPTFQIHANHINANVTTLTTTAQVSTRVDRAADSEA